MVKLLAMNSPHGRNPSSRDPNHPTGNEGTVPYFGPDFVGIVPYIGLKNRPYVSYFLVATFNQSVPEMAMDPRSMTQT